MRTMKCWTLALGLGLLWTATQAQAAPVGTPSRLNINVTVNAPLSVAVNDASSSTDTAVAFSAPNEALVHPSLASSTVRNDSLRTSRWALATLPESINTANNAEVWTLSTSTNGVGADQFAVQAVLGSSNTAAAGCPAANSTNWNQAYALPLDSSLPGVVYGATVNGDEAFAADTGDTPLTNDGTAGPDNAGNQRMFGGSRRALCWRIIGPSGTVTQDTQNIQVIVSAINP